MDIATSNRRPSPVSSRMIIGLVIVGVGLVLSLQNFGILTDINVFHFWPLVLIAIGARKLLNPVRPASRTWGAVMLALGGYFLLRNLGLAVVPFRSFFPLLLVAIGLSLVWRSVFPKGGEETAPPVDDAPPVGSSAVRLSEWAAFGGGERKITTEAFEGGEVTVIFGGLDLDLRSSSIQREQVTVDVFAMFGGVEMKVPAEWNVRVEGMPLFGGFDDKTVHPAGDPAAPAKRLVVRGAAVFGGVDIHN